MTCALTCSKDALYHKGNPNYGKVEWTTYGYSGRSDADVKDGRENGIFCCHMSVNKFNVCNRPALDFWV